MSTQLPAINVVQLAWCVALSLCLLQSSVCGIRVMLSLPGAARTRFVWHASQGRRVIGSFSSNP
jgi:hypothetical protein